MPIGGVSCKVCDKEFGRNGALNLHLAKNHNLKFNRYVCPNCSSSFTLKSQINQHMLNRNECLAHAQLLPEYTPARGSTEKKEACHLCPKLYKDKWALIKHVITKHYNAQVEFTTKKRGPSAPVKCHVCAESFSNAINMGYHLLSLHPNPADCPAPLVAEEQTVGSDGAAVIPPPLSLLKAADIFKNVATARTAATARAQDISLIEPTLIMESSTPLSGEYTSSNPYECELPASPNMIYGLYEDALYDYPGFNDDDPFLQPLEM